MMVLVSNWWSLVLRGICGVIFGLITFFRPGISLLTLVFLFGIYAIADGVFNIIAAFRRQPSQRPWWALLISGILGIIAGAIAIFIPGLTAIALLYLIATWAVVTGAFEIAAAIRLRKQIQGEWVMIVSGMLSIALGVLMMVFPGAGILGVLIWIGVYAFVSGILLIALGMRLRSWIKRTAPDVHDFPHGVAPSH